MRRLHVALTALVVATLAGPAAGAEISRVATSGEPGNLFDLDLGVRWDRTVEAATITRESSDTRLRYTRNRNAIVPRLALGLWHDLEAHFELPYVLGDDREWRFGTIFGQPSGPGGPYDSITGNTIDASGAACTGTCPIFEVGSKTTGYHGGRAGDVKAGFSWAIFNEKKDDTKPMFVVGMDVTAPTSAKWDPGANRGSSWVSPYAFQANPGPFGEKIWKWDVYTILSKRYRYVDPYLKAHAQISFKSAATYSNCDNAAQAVAAGQMNSGAVASCATLGSAAGAKLPFVAGLTFGTEFVPYEDTREGQKVTFDFRFFSELTSSQRFYNELTDATGKILQTEGYMEFGGLAGLYLRASRHVQLRAQASLATRTAHDLTGESGGTANPNFDYRLDAPGRRFRISEVSIFELSFAGILEF